LATIVVPVGHAGLAGIVKSSWGLFVTSLRATTQVSVQIHQTKTTTHAPVNLASLDGTVRMCLTPVKVLHVKMVEIALNLRLMTSNVLAHQVSGERLAILTLMNVRHIHVTRGDSVLTASTVTLATVRGLVTLDFRVLKTLMNVKQLSPVIRMQLASTILELTSVTVSQDLSERIVMRILMTVAVVPVRMEVLVLTKLLVTVVNAQLASMVSAARITLMTASQVHAIIILLVKMVSTVISVFVIQVSLDLVVQLT